MVKALGAPQRPLPDGKLWRWTPPTTGQATPWRWCRIYHRHDKHTPDGATFRGHGPLHRFDHHNPANPPTTDPQGRAVLYVADTLATAASEVFGESGIASLCPNFRVSIVEPTRPLSLLDLAGPGAAMAIGALPSLAQGNEPRHRTQEWARAIYEDRPGGESVHGVHYRTAYGDGYSLALWDCAEHIRIRRGENGQPHDVQLRHPPLMRRLQVEMTKRRISIELIAAADCTNCCR